MLLHFAESKNWEATLLEFTRACHWSRPGQSVKDNQIIVLISKSGKVQLPLGRDVCSTISRQINFGNLGSVIR